MPNIPKTVIELTDVSYLYSNTSAALSGISFKIHQGEKVAIIGANGSGKSTLLKIIDGLIYPTSGEVKVLGKLINEKSLKDEKFRKYFRKKVGFIFQDSDIQLFSPTVIEEVAFAPLQLDIPQRELKRRVSTALTRLGITRLANRSPFELSGGEKKKVAIASILSLSPEIWLLDEPTNNLDPKSVGVFLDFIFSLNDRKSTVIISTNDLAVVREIADSVLVLSENHELVKSGKSETVLNDKKLLEEYNLIHIHAHKHRKRAHKHIHNH